MHADCAEQLDQGLHGVAGVDVVRPLGEEDSGEARRKLGYFRL